MIQIDNSSSASIYQQIVDNIQELILVGVLKPDEALPSVRSLSIELKINPNTIQKAYKQLEQEGCIYSLLGKGSFVRSDLSFLLSKEKKELIKKIKINIERAKILSVKEDEYIAIVREAFNAENK